MKSWNPIQQMHRPIDRINPPVQFVKIDQMNQWTTKSENLPMRENNENTDYMPPISYCKTCQQYRWVRNNERWWGNNGRYCLLNGLWLYQFRKSIQTSKSKGENNHWLSTITEKDQTMTVIVSLIVSMVQLTHVRNLSQEKNTKYCWTTN